MSDAKVTMVLPDGNRWYIEAQRENGERVSLHLNVEPDQLVPKLGDILDLPDEE